MFRPSLEHLPSSPPILMGRRLLVIGGLVEPNETLIASATRYCMHLVDFCRKPNHRLYLTKVIHGFLDYEPVKISICVIDIFCKDLRWRARHHTPRMATQTLAHLNDIGASYEGQPGPLPHVEIPTNQLEY